MEYEKMLEEIKSMINKEKITRGEVLDVYASNEFGLFMIGYSFGKHQDKFRDGIMDLEELRNIEHEAFIAYLYCMDTLRECELI